MFSTGQRPVNPQCAHKEWKWEVVGKTKSFPLFERSSCSEGGQKSGQQAGNRGFILTFLFDTCDPPPPFKEGCTPAPIHTSKGRFLLASYCRRGVKERERNPDSGRRETERLGGTEGVFAAEGKAELLWSRKWDWLPSRSLCCVYVLWECVFLWGQAALHQHRSGLHMLYVLFLLEAALTVVHFLNCDLPCLFVRLRLWSLSYVVNVYEWLWVFQWMKQLRHTKADFVVFFLYLYVRIKWKTWCNLWWFIYCKLWCNGKDMWRTDDDTPREADQPDRFFFHWTCLYVCLTSK